MPYRAFHDLTPPSLPSLNSCHSWLLLGIHAATLSASRFLKHAIPHSPSAYVHSNWNATLLLFPWLPLLARKAQRNVTLSGGQELPLQTPSNLFFLCNITAQFMKQLNYLLRLQTGWGAQATSLVAHSGFLAHSRRFILNIWWALPHHI